MAQKRPFDEVVDEGSSKHQRLDGLNDEIHLYDAGESSSSVGKHESGLHEEPKNSSCHLIPRETVEDIKNDVPRSASSSHWTTSSTTDEDEPSEEMVQLPYLPGYFSFDHPVRPVINPEDVYRCLLEYPPRKHVPVGPAHQADIPSWQPQVNGTTSDDLGTTEPSSSGSNLGRTINGQGFGGVCVLPFLENKCLQDNGEKVGSVRAECMCSDQGSMRCVRQHIAEARDKLRKTLGQDTFMKLGFDDMGEIVANKWSEEEEQLFHEVVYSNPVSLGKNFWNVLSAVFSSRTKMDIVSYYFNVFMLRKRAAQNRCDPMNVDSDDDEWQGIDDGCEGIDDGVVSENDEDSGIESPVHRDVLDFYQNGLRLHEDEHYEHEHEHSHVDVVQKSGFDSGFEASVKKSDDDDDDDDDDAENDAQDGSCTSSDSGAPIQEHRLKSDGCQVWNDYIIDSSDAKVWDGYNLSFPKQSVEFLPTCSMIEEVFGDDDFESKNKRW